MKVSYQWLKDFVEIKVPAEKLADALTMAGLEVVGFEKHGDDAVLEIEITSNRPDWLSVIGVAREVAALTRGKFKAPAARVPPARRALGQGTRITIEDPADCPLYTAAVIRGVKVGPSPQWLKERLERIGCRSVNNVVDITNYCMFELGEPLHAFDLGKLAANEILVRRARPQETLVAIDGKSLALGGEFLVITDGKKPVALAGVMGGKESEVDEGTKDVLLEAAVFNPMLIRKARQKFGMQTDSSYRFERGIPAETVLATSSRARQMIMQLAGGREESFAAQGGKETKPRQLKLTVDNVSAFMGVKVSEAQVSHALSALGFSVRRQKRGHFLVGVPAFRQDARAAVDLIEDVARVYGFENVPSLLAPIPARPQEYGLRDFTGSCKRILSALGVHEAVTLSLVDRGLLQDAGFDAQEAVPIANPLSREQEVMRPTLIPSLLVSVRTNFNRQEPYVALFEAAHTFRTTGKGAPRETATLGMVFSGTRSLFLPQGQVKDQAGILHAKGAVLALLSGAGITGAAFVEKDGGFEVKAGDRCLGWMRLIPKKALETMEIKNREVAAAEIDLEAMYAARAPDKHFIRPPQFPDITRDVSFYVKEEVQTQAILDAVSGLRLPLLEEARVTDYYKGKQIPAGTKGLVLSCVYRSAERTLLESEVQPLHASVVQLLQGSFGAGVR